MSGHTPDCWREPGHHVCAAAAMAYAQGQRDEARAATAQAYQRLAGHEALLIETVAGRVVEQQALERVDGLLAEYRGDLATKGEGWHPRFRVAVELVVDQLAQALRGGAHAFAAPAAGEHP